DGDVLALSYLEAFHDVGALDRLVLFRAVPDLADARQVFLVQHVEMDRLRTRGREEAYRERDESEAEIALPDGRWHRQLFFTSPRSPWPLGTIVFAWWRRSAASDLPTFTWSCVKWPCSSRRT